MSSPVRAPELDAPVCGSPLAWSGSSTSSRGRFDASCGAADPDEVLVMFGVGTVPDDDAVETFIFWMGDVALCFANGLRSVAELTVRVRFIASGVSSSISAPGTGCTPTSIGIVGSSGAAAA